MDVLLLSEDEMAEIKKDVSTTKSRFQTNIHFEKVSHLETEGSSVVLLVVFVHWLTFEAC